MKRPTMVDVATEASVSLRTVSRFVNGDMTIAPALTERIRDAIDTLGYTRNLAAASIRPGQTGQVIGLIIEDVSNPFYSTLTRSIEEVVRRSDYVMISASSESDGSLFDSLLNRMVEQRVDGLVIVPPKNASARLAQPSAYLPPVVFVDRPGPLRTADSVLADDCDGAAAGVRCLIRAGARRVAFVGDSLRIHTMAERLRGYELALAEAGLDLDPLLVLTSVHDATEAATAVLDLMAHEPAVDAIFTANNRASVGALRAFRESKRRLALVGFDDFEGATLVDPGVTVVSSSVHDMGARAAHLLVRRLQGRDAEAQHVTIPAQLIPRGSEHPPSDRPS